MIRATALEPRRGAARRCAALASALAVVLCIWAAPATGADHVERWGSFGGESPPARSPTPVSGLANVTQIDVSNSSAYALQSNGTVWAWGHGGQGQLGDGSTSSSEGKAVKVAFPAGTFITALGEAENSGVAIDSSHHAWAWGQTGATTCMEGPHSERNVPTPVESIKEAIAVQGGEHHTVWLLPNGTVETCGDNQQGQLGVGGTDDSAKPVLVPGLDEVVELSAGERTTCARTASGLVYDWGSDASGQIGNGITEPAVSKPYLVPLPGPAEEISCGGNLPTNGHALALVGGQLYGWGADAAGQLGDGATQEELSPIATGLHFARVVASGSTSYGLTIFGQIYAWGSNYLRALGGGPPTGSLRPLLVDSDGLAISGTARNAGAVIG